MVVEEEQEGEANPKPKHVHVLADCSCGICGTAHGLFEVEIQPGGEITGAKDDCLKPIAHFFDKKTYVLPQVYRLQAVRVSQPHRHYSSTSKLYLLIREYERVLAQDVGFVFNTENRSLATIPPLRGPKRKGLIFSAYGKIYSLAIRVDSEWLPPRASFACYDLSSRKKARTIWEKLPSFPYSESRGTTIYGYAVCHGCILFSLRCEFWVFHIDTKTWHPVELPEEEHFCAYFTFNGRAVIVDDTIYALSSCRFGTVVSFSFRIHLEGDGRTTYSLEKSYLFEPLGRWCYGYNPERQYLVPLGKLQFSLVQTHSGCKLLITTFEIVRGGDGGKMEIKTLHSTLRALDIGAIHEGCNRFSINFAYTLECEDFEPGEEFMKKRNANAKRKRRNRNTKKNFNWDTDDSDCEFLDPNSWLPDCMESQRNICNQDKRKRKRRMKDVKFLGSYAGDVIQSIKVIHSIGPECEVSVPGGQAACQLKIKELEKKSKQWSDKEQRNWEKRNQWSDKEQWNGKKMNSLNRYTKGSEAEYWDPNSSFPLWSDKKEKRNWKKRNNLNRVLEDVGPKEKTTSDDASAFLDSNQDASTERRKPSSAGAISENSRSSESQVVRSGSRPSLWFVWFGIMEALSLFLLLLEEVEYFFCPWTKPSYWDKSLEKRLVISENSSGGGGGRSLSQVVKSTSQAALWSAWFGFEDAISLFGLVLHEIVYFLIPSTKPLDCGRCDMCRELWQGRLGVTLVIISLYSLANACAIVNLISLLSSLVFFFFV